MEYYTYAYLREDRTPYYVGKGKGDRVHNRGKKTELIIIKQPEVKVESNVNALESLLYWDK